MSRKKIFIKIITKKSGLFPSSVYNTILNNGLFPFFFINFLLNTLHTFLGAFKKCGKAIIRFRKLI